MMKIDKMTQDNKEQDVVTLNLEQAFGRYEQIRARLPQIRPPQKTQRNTSLLEIIAHYDGFVFDSFGVLNVGESAIDGAAECLALLRKLGKPYCVLTNAASYTADMAVKKYARMGLDVRHEDIISSRDIAVSQLLDIAGDIKWAAIADFDENFSDIDADIFDIFNEPNGFDKAEGFIFLSSARWNASLQEHLIAELKRKKRILVIANPDLVAPRESGLTIEPGFWGHDLQDRIGIEPAFFGKPYATAFAVAKRKLGSGKLAMVGDTLHTDILGGQSHGFDTILVTKHGLFAGKDVNPYIEQSKIWPDWIIPSI